MRRISYLLLSGFSVFVILVGFSFRPAAHNPQPITPNPPPITSSVLGSRTKSTDCTVNGALPDSDCTPGSVFPEVTVDQICTPGYSASVRNVPDSVKKQVYAEYGVITHLTGEYEVDHLISLELGGSNDVSNLWPEAADPRPGFHEKDQVENYLHKEVCRGVMTLKDAQAIIAHDWLSVIVK
jgi:hypothetical protein